MRALNRKLLRDMWRMRGQALAIALVIASGVTTHVTSYSVVGSLQATRDDFYRAADFADVFATLERAPQAVATTLSGIPGVRRLETRVTARGLVDVPGFDEPVSALVMSLPNNDGGLNRLYLRSGRLPESDRETAVNEAFAEAHSLAPGSLVTVNIDGLRRELLVSAIVLSPEFTYLMRPGDLLPDYKRYGVLWMQREPLAAAAGMQDAFNDAVLTLDPGAREEDVVADLDRELSRWGGVGAIGRDLQLSDRFLSDEIRQVERMAKVVPFIFLTVAAFLLNVVLTRMLAQHRVQIAVLKAFGYHNMAIVAHYLKFSALIVAMGAVIGIVAGSRLGQGQASLYAEFYRFPHLHYVLTPWVALAAVLVSAVAAMFGTLTAVLRVARLPPAAGIRPEEPPHIHAARARSGVLHRLLSPPGRMVVRSVLRRPVRSALTVVGLALAGAVLVVGGFMWSSIDFMLDVQFTRAYRADLTVTFPRVTSRRVLHELRTLPGVRHVEPFRAASVRLRYGHREERVSLQGLPGDATLQRTLNERFAPVTLSGGGVLLTDHLAQKLGLRPGDTIQVERLDGDRSIRDLPVTGVVGEFVGHNAYMNLDALNDWLGDGEAVTGALLLADRASLGAIYETLKQSPHVVSVTSRGVVRQTFNETLGQNVLIFAFVNLCLASTIAVGVVYNSMRTTMSERAHELASLRVLGYSRTEAGYVLLGEIVLLTMIALPIGALVGYGFCGWIARALASDLYRVPLVVWPTTYANAAVAVLGATALSALVMVRHIRRLNLVSALKVAQ